KCNTSCHGSNGDRSICCCTCCIRWCDLYCCQIIGVLDCNLCRKYTTIIILYVNCVRSCCKIIINKGCTISSSVKLVSVWCYSSEIGRASCRKECRSRWSAVDLNNNDVGCMVLLIVISLVSKQTCV